MNFIPRKRRYKLSPVWLLCTAIIVLATGLSAVQINAMQLIGSDSPMPLSPEEAFKPSIHSADENRIVVKFDIADEYYLYQKRFIFTTDSSAEISGKPKYPEALIHEDAYFGKSKIFRDEMLIELDVTNSTQEYELTAVYQGCADMGLCYPPTTSVLKVSAPHNVDNKTNDVGKAAPIVNNNHAAASNKLDQAFTAATNQRPAVENVARQNPSTQNNIQQASVVDTTGDITLAKNAGIQNIAPDNVLAENSVKTPSKVNLNDLFKSSGLGNDSAPLLGPQAAFVPSILNANADEIEVQWFIEPGYYLYRDKISFSLEDADGATVAEYDVDRGRIQNDAYFGDVEVLREVPTARISLTNADNLSSATLSIKSQGCADIGVCFPPEVNTLKVNFDKTRPAGIASVASPSGTSGTSSLISANNVVSEQLASSASSAAPSVALPNAVQSQAQTQALQRDQAPAVPSIEPLAQTQITAPAQTTAQTAAQAGSAASAITASTAQVLPETEQTKLTRLLEGGSLLVIALTFYVAGILLAFTACMYPMIPILSSLIVGQGANIGATRAFSLSLIYVLSMASVFAVVGVLVGLSGFNIQPLFQNPWVLTAFAALFVLLALSMFGVFQLQMPSSIQTKMNEISNKQKSGSWTGVATMGMLSALIVGPCVTPPLVAALAFIANTGDARIGGIALFAIGIGMGTPLLFIGTSLGRFMPKAGGWMENMQRFFGVILIAVAIYMLSRFLPANAIMVLSALLAIFTGVYFGATDKLDQNSRGSQRFGKSFGIVALLYGIVLMIGALSGTHSLLSPLKGFTGQQIAAGGAVVKDQHVEFKRIKTTQDLQDTLALAKAENRPVMLDFYADWCISCKEMEAFVFPDQRVRDQLEGAILIQADVTKNDEYDKAMLKEFSLFGPPAIILYSSDGTEMTNGRVVGYMNAEKFSTHLDAYLN